MFQGKTKTLVSEGLRLKFLLTFSFVNLEKLLDFFTSQFPHVQNAEKKTKQKQNLLEDPEDSM